MTPTDQKHAPESAQPTAPRNPSADRTSFLFGQGTVGEALQKLGISGRAIAAFLDQQKVDPDARLRYPDAKEDLANWPDDRRDLRGPEALGKDDDFKRAFIRAHVGDIAGDDLANVHRSVENALERKNPAKRTGQVDPVAEEIARQVTLRWNKRKKLRADEPWIKNPSSYVKKVFATWYEAGTLCRRHLRIDVDLYDAYAKHIKAHPADDLNLPTDESVMPKHADPTEKQKLQREQSRLRMLRYRARAKLKS